MWVFWQYTPKLSRAEEDSARSVLRGSQCARDLEKYGRWASERVEMSAGRVDRTRAVATRLIKSDLTNRKSVRERLRKNGRWASERVEMSADRLDRTRAVSTRLANCDPTKRKSVRQRLRKIQVEWYEGG